MGMQDRSLPDRDVFPSVTSPWWFLRATTPRSPSLTGRLFTILSHKCGGPGVGTTSLLLGAGTVPAGPRVGSSGRGSAHNTHVGSACLHAVSLDEWPPVGNGELGPKQVGILFR